MKTLYWIIGAVIILGGTYFGSTINKQNELAQVVTSSAPSDWKTYTEHSLGFEIKYPVVLASSPSWTVTTQYPIDEKISGTYNELFFGFPGDGDKIGWTVQRYENSKLDFLISKSWNQISSNQKIQTRQNISIGGIHAVFVTTTAPEWDKFFKAEEIYIKANSKLYVIKGTDYEDIDIDTDFKNFWSSFKPITVIPITTS